MHIFFQLAIFFLLLLFFSFFYYYIFLFFFRKSKYNVETNNTHSVFQILSAVSILFNIFVINLFLCLIKKDLHNFSYDNTITAAGKTIKEVIIILEEENKLAVAWFKGNNMLLSPHKFQAIVVKRNSQLLDIDSLLDILIKY